MLSSLGLSTPRPPNGWLICLIKALQEQDRDNRYSYLILDEFANEVGDQVDSSFVEAIKSLIRNTEIRVILLTPSESCADFLLTRNNLVGIVPLQGTYPVSQHPNGEWQSMTWPVETLKIAARHEPSLATVLDQVEQQIDIFLGKLTATQRQQLTYVEVLRELKRSLLTQRTVTQLDVTTSSSIAEDENQWCSACVIS